LRSLQCRVQRLNMSYTGPEITLTMTKLQETVRLRLFETRLWAKEMVLTQLLVTDQTANILSNFLAVFLALAARSLYNVVRRILRVFNSGHEDKTQILGAGVAGRAGSDDSVTEPTGAQPQSPPIETPRNTATTTLEEIDITDSTEAISEARGTDAMNASEAQERHERQLERLEVIDESHDTETLILKTFRKFISQLLSIVPVRPLGDNTPTHRRMLKTKFWSNMFKIANESSGNLLWHLLVGLGALVLYFGALLLGIMSAYPVVGDSVAVSHHPQCGIVLPPTAQMDDAVHFALVKKYYNDIARESRQYAKSCYDLGDSASDAPSPDSCSFLYKPSIKYSIIDNDACPFKIGAGHLCLEGITVPIR
jgi:hypothetical protein